MLYVQVLKLLICWTQAGWSPVDKHLYKANGIINFYPHIANNSVDMDS